MTRIRVLGLGHCAPWLKAIAAANTTNNRNRNGFYHNTGMLKFIAVRTPPTHTALNCLCGGLAPRGSCLQVRARARGFPVESLGDSPRTPASISDWHFPFP